MRACISLFSTLAQRVVAAPRIITVNHVHSDRNSLLDLKLRSSMFPFRSIFKLRALVLLSGTMRPFLSLVAARLKTALLHNLACVWTSPLPQDGFSLQPLFGECKEQ